ncbi:hypothetical protein CY34DRAFT_83476, partial [Suillus luteus UH-Slu-Lm8-n1]
LSWWPRPQAWAGSGLDVGFWSERCESWFQIHHKNKKVFLVAVIHPTTTAQ